MTLTFDGALETAHCRFAYDKGEVVARIFGTILIHILFLACFSASAAQTPDGTLKITRRSVAEGIGLTWGDGVLNYQGKEHPFSFHASGRLRNVDVKMTTAELSGQVFNLKSLEDFNGNYKTSDGEKTASGGGTRVAVKNHRGVVVHLASNIEGRKFSVAREGIDIELKTNKP